MEPIIILPVKQVEDLVNRYEQATARLIEAENELAALKEDKYVDYDWVCAYFDITKPTAVAMLADEKVFVYGPQIKRFKKSAIIKFAERNCIQLKKVTTK